ncbi:MAG TPA: hypothetical protein VHC97_28460 [Thermoanaerobaculia bacterium]|jgi:hypothetical protein|nr:hypothetical protein [Thermoanaerobaculia bacterium]
MQYEREEHRSPDGTLTLVVMCDGEDVTVGFGGFEWHTHGDLLAADYPFADITGLTPDEAAQRLVQDILSNRVTLAVLRVGGQVREVWPTLDPEEELRYLQPGEDIEFRLWSVPHIPGS